MTRLTVAQALADAKAMGVPRLDAQLLLARALQCPRSWLLAHDDAVLESHVLAQWHAELRRRSQGEPLAYIVGEKEFHGLLLAVDARVLVPRPETEVLVDWALEVLAGPLSHATAPRVADLGTGSGAIALALKHSSPLARLVATDASSGALAVAGANAGRLHLDIEFRLGDWWAALDGERFNLVVSNPPYIEPGDPHLLALGHEPLAALTPGTDGLAALRAIVHGAGAHFDHGGWLLLEHGHDQAASVQHMLTAAGFTAVQTRADLAGLPRCTGACRA
jgi:release factor glutamine methyltransferase